MSMVSDDFGLRYLIFHSFHEKYTQAFISVVTYIIGAFPLHGTVRFGTARYGTAQFGSVCISTAV